MHSCDNAIIIVRYNHDAATSVDRRRLNSASHMHAVGTKHQQQCICAVQHEWMCQTSATYLTLDHCELIAQLQLGVDFKNMTQNHEAVAKLTHALLP